MEFSLSNQIENLFENEKKANTNNYKNHLFLYYVPFITESNAHVWQKAIIIITFYVKLSAEYLVRPITLTVTRIVNWYF